MSGVLIYQIVNGAIVFKLGGYDFLYKTQD